MDQKYVIHVEGKPVVLLPGPPVGALPEQMLVMRVDHASEVHRAVERMLRVEGLRGAVLHAGAFNALWDAFRAPYSHVLAAGGAVEDAQGRLLAIRRLGRWDLPKGKVDAGEHVEQAALREVREECGLQRLELLAPLCATWHTYDRGGRRYLKCTEWFHMRGDSSEPLVPQGEEDITEVAWLDAGGVERLKAETYPSLLSVVEAWERRAWGRTSGPARPAP